MINNVVQILQAGKALIADPTNHAKGGFAFDKHGAHVDPTSELACSFCSVGALMKVLGVSPELGHPAHFWMIRDYLDNAAYDLFKSLTVEVNDCRTHSEVMSVWDRAIEASKGVQ